MATKTQKPAQAIDQLAINTIRTLSMDAVQQANSGHPGTPMALAPVAYALWSQYLNYDPANPDWPNYLKAAVPLLGTMENKILTPLPWSPVK